MKDKFIKNSLIVIILTTIASATNYLSQIFMSHSMPLASFGLINTIFSFIAVASVPGNTFNLLAAKYIAERPQSNRMTSVISVMLRYALITSLTLLAFFIIGERWISRILNSDNFLINLLTILVVCMSFLPLIYSGALAGLKKFVQVGILSLIMPLFKIVGAFGISAIENNDSKIIIVLLTIIIGYIFTVLLGLLFVKHNKPASGLNKNIIDDQNFNLGKFGLSTMLSNIMFMFFSNFDIFAVNTFFGEIKSGLYSSAMLFGRIVFYLVTALVTVMLPFVASENIKNGSPKSFLKKTLLYTTVISILLITPLNIAPDFFLGLVYGKNYLEATKYIPYASIIAVLTSILNIAINYLIGIEQLKTLLHTFSKGLVLGVTVIYFWHDSATQVLLCISIDLALLAIINIKNCFNDHPQRRGIV